MHYQLTGITKKSKFIYYHICYIYPDGKIKYLEMRLFDLRYFGGEIRILSPHLQLTASGPASWTYVPLCECKSRISGTHTSQAKSLARNSVHCKKIKLNR